MPPLSSSASAAPQSHVLDARRWSPVDFPFAHQAQTILAILLAKATRTRSSRAQKPLLPFGLLAIHRGKTHAGHRNTCNAQNRKALQTKCRGGSGTVSRSHLVFEYTLTSSPGREHGHFAEGVAPLDQLSAPFHQAVMVK